MSVNVTRLTDSEEWNALVAQSPQRTPFHYFQALEVAAEYSETTLHPYAGYKGEEPVGLFPMFSRSWGPVRAAFSPPQGWDISYLGPILLNQEKVKRRKAEKRHRRFKQAVDEIVADEIDPHYTHVRTGPGYSDPRPLIWDGFDADTRFTYTVDVTPSPDELFMSFSSDVRKNVRNAEDDEYELLEGGVEDVEQIVGLVEERHAEQDAAFGVTRSFAADLYRNMPDGTVRAHLLRSGGETVGGVLALEDGETVYRWLAFNDHDHDLAAADVIDWHIIRDAHGRGLERYDLVDANIARLCGYKAKFNPDLRTFYNLKRSNRLVDALRILYSRFN